jgi:TIR domain
VDAVKIFLSHASEDQADFVRPLAEALSAFPQEFKVWYSEYELTLGDKLLAKIDAGLKNCDYGVVVLSPHFFAKRWPREELEGLFQLETTERKVILPIWKEVSESEVRSFSPILASRLGADATAGAPKIVEDIRRAVGLVDRYKELSSSVWRDKFKKLDEDVGHARRVEQFSATGEAVELVSKIAFELIDEAWKTAEKLVTELSSVKLHLAARKNERHYFVITGPRRLTLNLHFSNVFVNSIERARLKLIIFRAKDDWDDKSENEILENYDLRPTFDKEMKILWTDSTMTFATGTALIDFAFEKFVAALEADRQR